MGTRKGIVYLVGAGPGDAGLLTLRGAECLARADVIVYDHLVNEALLCHASQNAERIYVGKRAGSHTMPQDEINKLLATHATQGKTVVRLKGGDPFLFGRGGEEALYLADHSVPFEVVPGVTSAIAVPAYAGIPVSQRGYNVSVHIITGHEAPEKSESDLDWKALARCEGTLVFLMGVANLDRIAKELIRHGRPSSTPCAVIRWGTLPEQTTVVAPLGEIAERVRAAQISPPAITVVGEVVRLRDQLKWYERKPLFGVRVAVTRPPDQSRELIAYLREAGADVLLTPTIEIHPRPLTEEVRKELELLHSYDWAVFTSANGVHIFFEYLGRVGQDARSLADLRIAAIGDKTAEALSQHGIRADVTPDRFVQEALASAIPVLSGDRVLIPRAAAARDALERDLTARGGKVRVLPLYDTRVCESGVTQLLRELREGRVHVVTFTSASTFESLAESAHDADLPQLLQNVLLASIGPITSAAITRKGCRVAIEASHHNAQGLAEAIIEFFANERSRSALEETKEVSS